MDQEIIQDRRSEGFEDNDPALFEMNEGLDEQEERYQDAEDDEEEEKYPNEHQSQRASQESRQLEWHEVEDSWHPNWLQRFHGQMGVSQNFPSNIQQASEYFSLFYDTEVLDLIVTETNRYAEQYLQSNPLLAASNYYQNWTPCTRAKLKCYLALIMHMGIVQLPRLSDHWSKSYHYACLLCPSVMTKNEFFCLHGFIHFVNNRTANLEDKLYKIQDLLNLLIVRFKRYMTLPRDITLDERMVRYTGRLSFLQYIRNKPNQYGIKVYLVTDARFGYTYDFKVYTGAEENPNRSHSAIYNTVVQLLNRLGGKGHVLYYDSFYAYRDVIEYLTAQQIGSVCTVNSRRTFLPGAIKKARSGMAKGEAVFRRCGNLLALLYKDRSNVRLLSNVHSSQIENGRPIALRDYNQLAKGVDRSNQRIASYFFRHRHLKWYKTLHVSFLETCLSNAYILYKIRTIEPKKYLQFREDVINEFIQQYLDLRHMQLINRPESRLITGMHRIGTRDQRNCYICSTKENRRTSIYYCLECDKNICIIDCFYRLHTLLVIHTRNKIRNL